MTIDIYTDGSCLGNPGAGGWAALIVPEDGTPQAIGGPQARTTNNRMEQTAVIKALEQAPTGAQVPLTQVAEVRFVAGPPMIRSEDGQKLSTWIRP